MIYIKMVLIDIVGVDFLLIPAILGIFSLVNLTISPLHDDIMMLVPCERLKSSVVVCAMFLMILY